MNNMGPRTATTHAGGTASAYNLNGINDIYSVMTRHARAYAARRSNADHQQKGTGQGGVHEGVKHVKQAGRGIQARGSSRGGQ